MKAGLSFLEAAGMGLAAGLWIVNASLAGVSNMHTPSAQALYERAVRDLEALRGNVPARDSQAIVGRAYFQNVTLETPPNLDRRYAKDAKLEQVPVTDCPSLTVAAVLPHILSAKPSVVLCKSRLANDLEVAVYSADGKDKKCLLYKGKIGSGMNGQSDTLVFTWDGADPATKAKLPRGNYTVRWTVQDGCCDHVVTIPE
jgi:hypothetical protein